MNEEVIVFQVEQFYKPIQKNITYNPALNQLVNETLVNTNISISKAVIKNNVTKCINDVLDTIDDENLNNNYEVKELEFTLSVNSEGEVSILSLASASISSQAGITIRIAKK